MYPPKAILVPTDFSAYSDKAIAQAAEIAQQSGARLVLLHVVDRLQQCAIDYCIPLGTLQKVQADSESEARRKMEQEAKKILSAKNLDLAFDVRIGTPWEEILKEQQAQAVRVGGYPQRF